MVRLPNGRKVRISGTPELNTKAAAQEEERLHIQRMKNPTMAKPAAPKFGDFFIGRFWQEWVIARKNKPGEMEEKKRVYERYLRPRFANKRLDEILDDDVLRLHSELSKTGLGEKSINNIATVSKPLRYAADVRLIEVAPKVRLYKVEPPEIGCWEIEEYSSILSAAVVEGAEWHRAVMLALPVSDVVSESDRVQVLFSPSNRRLYPGVYAIFDERWAPNLSHVRKGTLRKIIGRIQRVDATRLALDKAELDDTR